MREESAYLLQNQLNPFPVVGELTLEDGRLRFTLVAKAAGANLGWLEKATGQANLKARLQDGERPMVFDLDLQGRKVSWPASLGKVAMKVVDDDRNWIVSLDYPSGGALWQTLNMLGAKSRTKPWKAALASAGAR